MPNCEPLAWYGGIVLILTGCLIIIPYFLRKAELVSAWNFLLVGVAIFVGIGCLEAAVSPLRFRGLEWFQPTRAEVQRYMLYTTAFLVVMIATYYFDPLTRAASSRIFNKWPPITPKLLIWVLLGCIPFAFALMLEPLRHIIFVSQVVINVSHKAMVFSVVFSFVLWYRNRLNLFWLAAFIVVFMAMCLMGILSGPGRRVLVSMFVGPVVVFYFYTARHWRPTRSMVILACSSVVLFSVSLMYSTIRHYDRIGGRHERDAAGAIEAVKNIDSTRWFERFQQDMLWNLSQSVVHYALLTDRFVETGLLEEKPFNTFKFFLVYPIPRAIYPNKPEGLGSVITTKVLKATTTWGTGVAGHSAYEGGVIIAIMFGYLAGFGCRMFDDPLRRHPTNPFLIAMVSAAAMHLIAWPRGDLSTMTFEVAECIFFTIGLCWITRLVFGTERAPYSMRYPPAHMPHSYQVPSR